MTDSISMARFFNLMRIFREERGRISLDHDEESVLLFVLERSQRGTATTVSNLVASQFFGTPPTVQKKVNQLVAKRILVIMRCADDSRKQNLVATPMAMEYFERLCGHLSVESSSLGNSV